MGKVDRNSIQVSTGASAMGIVVSFKKFEINADGGFFLFI